MKYKTYILLDLSDNSLGVYPRDIRDEYPADSFDLELLEIIESDKDILGERYGWIWPLNHYRLDPCLMEDIVKNISPFVTSEKTRHWLIKNASKLSKI